MPAAVRCACCRCEGTTPHRQVLKAEPKAESTEMLKGSGREQDRQERRPCSHTGKEPGKAWHTHEAGASTATMRQEERQQRSMPPHDAQHRFFFLSFLSVFSFFLFVYGIETGTEVCMSNHRYQRLVYQEYNGSLGQQA